MYRIRVGPALRFALIRHDIAIAIAVLRQQTKRIGDLLTALVIFPILAIVARAWLDGLSENRREIVALGVSWLIASVIANALVKRVWFHQTDGVLAHFAQRFDEWLGYALPLLVTGLFVGLCGMAMIGLPITLSVAFGIGCGVATGLVIPFLRDHVGRWLRYIPLSGRHTPYRRKHVMIVGAAFSALIGVVCAFLPQKNDLDALFLCGYGLAVILLTGRIEIGEVRYMTLVGASSATMLRNWLSIQIALLLPVTAVLLAVQNWIYAGLAGLFALGLPAITALRIFSYRVFSRFIADWIVSIQLLVAGYASFIFLPLGPAIIIAQIILLARRGEQSRWLLA